MPGRLFLALYLALFATLCALVLAFNFEQTTNFTWWPGRTLESVHLVYVVLGALVLGAVYASAVALLEQVRLSMQIRGLKRKLHQAEQELARHVSQLGASGERDEAEAEPQPQTAASAKPEPEAEAEAGEEPGADVGDDAPEPDAEAPWRR